MRVNESRQVNRGQAPPGLSLPVRVGHGRGRSRPRDKGNPRGCSPDSAGPILRALDACYLWFLTANADAPPTSRNGKLRHRDRSLSQEGKDPAVPAPVNTELASAGGCEVSTTAHGLQLPPGT